MTRPAEPSKETMPGRDWMPDEAAIDAIVRGEHGDPFSVLGLKRGQFGASLCAFLPGAAAVTAFDPETGVERKLARLHEAGFSVRVFRQISRTPISCA